MTLTGGPEMLGDACEGYAGSARVAPVKFNFQRQYSHERDIAEKNIV